MNAPLVGVAGHYAAFVKLCRMRIEQLEITFETVDAIAGFPARYTAKLLGGGNSRKMSAESMFAMLSALALTPAFHHDDRQHGLLTRRQDWIKLKRKGERWRGKQGSAKHKLGADYFKILGTRGGMIRARKLTRKRRRLIAIRAAQARWHKPALADRIYQVVPAQPEQAQDG